MAADESDCRSFVVRPAAGHLRRVLGPSTWVVLESLLARSTGTTEESIVAISIRALAVDVALSKDTVTRAVGQLHRVGLLTVVHPRTTGGTFGPTEYRLSVPADMFDLNGPIDVPLAHLPHRQRTPSRPTATDAQLSFTEF